MVMKRVLLLAIMLTGTAHCQSPRVLAPTGMGVIQVGMDVDELNRVLHTKLPYVDYVNHGCGVVSSKELEPYGITLMVESSHLTRINVDFYGNDPRPREIKTAAGIGLGSPEQDVTAAYAGKTRIVPNPEDPTWHTIYVDDPDGQHALIFETDGTKVKSMHAGVYPGVAYPDGCN
jgi:hypothetical protein